MAANNSFVQRPTHETCYDPGSPLACAFTYEGVECAGHSRGSSQPDSGACERSITSRSKVSANPHAHRPLLLSVSAPLCSHVRPSFTADLQTLNYLSSGRPPTGLSAQGRHCSSKADLCENLALALGTGGAFSGGSGGRSLGTRHRVDWHNTRPESWEWVWLAGGMVQRRKLFPILFVWTVNTKQTRPAST